MGFLPIVYDRATQQGVDVFKDWRFVWCFALAPLESFHGEVT